MPATIFRLTSHVQTMYDHIVVSICRGLTAANITSHSNVEKNSHLPHWPCTLGDISLHNRSTINIPDHSTLTRLSTRLEPCKVIPDGAMLHVGDLSTENTMLVRFMVMTPVQTRVILKISIPRLRNVHLTICRPRKRLLGKKPECRPDTRRAG